MAHRYPQPGNEDEFEDFCLRYYRQLWSCESLELYGKRGERQDGIDIIDQLRTQPFRAIQCKCHEPTKNLPPAEIRKEVAKVEASEHAVEQYVIATTAKKSNRAQDAAIKLNERPDRQVTVQVHFWEDVCIRLSEMPRAVAETIVYGQSILAADSRVTQSGAGAETSHVVTVSIGPGEAPNARYSEIHALFDARKIEIAEYEILKLPDPETSTLPRDEKYAFLRLRAKLALERCRFEDAARLFHAAYHEVPELDQAKQNHVRAFELENDNERAYREADRFISEGLRTATLTAMLVRNASTADQLRAHAALIEEFAATDEDVNLSLAQKYVSFREYDNAEAAAARALAIAPDSAHAHFCVAMAAHEKAVYGTWTDREKNLEIALRHYTLADEGATRDKYSGLLPEVLLNRGNVKTFMRDATAADDFRRAVAVTPHPAGYAERAISYFVHHQDFTAAKDLSVHLDRRSLESQFLATMIDYHHARGETQRVHIHEMAALAEKSWERAVEVRFHCVQWAINLHDDVLATSFVTPSFRETHPFQARTMDAWIHVEAGRDEDAKQAAAKALDQSIENAHRQEIALLASILVRLGDYKNALPLFEHVTVPGMYDENCRRLIGCAERLDRHDTLLRICGELRATGQQNDAVQRMEIELLGQYAPEKAFDLIDAAIARAEKTAFFVAFRNYLAVRLRRRNALVLDASQLPSPGDLEPGEARIIVTPYAEAGMYAEALVFLYRQLRLHFTEERAHGQFLSFVIQYGKRSGICDAPDAVTVNCAVLLENTVGGARHWFIIEDENPDAARGEFPPTHPIAHLVMSRGIGYVIDLPGNPAQPQRERICDVQTKYVRLFQDCLENFHHRFPTATFLQRIHVGQGESFDPTPVIESLKEDRTHVDEVLRLYRENLWSLHFFATQLGISELEAVKVLATRDGMELKCSAASVQEFTNRAAQGIPGNTIVLDMSAIVALTLLKAWDCLDSCKKYLIAQSTVDKVAEWVHEHSDDHAQPAGYTVLTDEGELARRDLTPEEIEKARDELLAMQAAVDKHCTRQSSLSLSQMEPTKRSKYADILGYHSIESLSIAKDNNCFLWTDDLFLSFLAKGEFSVQSVWTQLAMKVFVDGGHLTESMYHEITAKLAAWQYSLIVWNADTIIAAGRFAQWYSGDWPLRQCIGLVAKSEISLAQRTQVVGQVLRLVRLSSCPELLQTPIVQACLTALDSSVATRALLHRLQNIFGLDVLSERFIRLELEYWLAHH